MPQTIDSYFTYTYTCHSFSSMPDSIPTFASLDLTGVQFICYIRIILEGTIAKTLVIQTFQQSCNVVLRRTASRPRMPCSVGEDDIKF